MTGQPIQLLIADDHPVFRQGLRTMLDSTSEFDVIGEAADGDEAVARALT
jgi:DNA-binding NarL/FixJ family response regulator